VGRVVRRRPLLVITGAPGSEDRLIEGLQEAGQLGEVAPAGVELHRLTSKGPAGLVRGAEGAPEAPSRAWEELRASGTGTAVQMPLRVPPGLHARLKARAAEGGASLNMLCVRFLEEGLAGRQLLEEVVQRTAPARRARKSAPAAQTEPEGEPAVKDPMAKSPG
jgi:hypothetical protein